MSAGLHSEPVPAPEGRRAAPLPSQSSGAGRAGQWVVPEGSQERGADDEGRGAPQARPDPAAVPSSSRLDKGTTCDLDQEQRDKAYRIVVRDYGAGLVEASVTVNNLRRRPPKTTAIPREKTPEQKAENEERALRRARTAVRQTIMAAKLDHLLTLTYRENQTDAAIAWKHWAKFMRSLRRRRAGNAFPFVAVIERQKRGAIHVHMAVSGYQNVALLRALWHDAIGSKEGNIDVQFFRQKLPTLARYLSKYITKDLGDEHLAGAHRYKRARGVEVPKVVVCLPFDVAVDCELLQLFEAAGATVRFHKNRLTHEGPKWLWACSW